MSKAPTLEFHVARAVRDRYRFDDVLFTLTGNVVFANLAASREFAQRINKGRDAERHPDRAVSHAALNAMGIVDEALHLVAATYRQQRDPRAMLDALQWFESRLGRPTLDRTLLTFADYFPVTRVYRGVLTPAEWLADSSAGVPNRALALEELLMLWMANLNPAFRKFSELFDETALASTTAYTQITSALRDYFETRPRFGPENQNFIDLLRAPMMASPHSLEGQLAYISEKWKDLLGDFVRRLLTALDVLKEEEIAVWLRFHPPGHHFGAPMTFGDSSVAAIPLFTGPGYEYEAFSSDIEWMPRTVVIAKSIYVWLDQLSKTYGRSIHRLDGIPDEELEMLARRGFNGLWLIGIWERSQASQNIKKMTGNPEAAASAYSLDDYAIAADLGGEGAFSNLRDRAWAHGIRLASDMVPNHMGIDSRWVIEHPDWFLSLPYSPFPAYRFDGPDLSSDGRVEIKIEDHYYDQTDAAVVFRRVDRWTGDTRLIYHGNDGTSFPWNDTAQLNYLKPEVREAVIQTIIQVARRFPIIRFDAAMTLTKQHYQRLWFPIPGTGGSIPSRAEYGLTKPEFDAAMPREFWREVVDRVSAEVPGTLLLAEAFWLLEGYFVRTLGMHRVYNSAFMNMLRDEENANYRSVIKKTLEFDPEVLKRYVNFMNNPDERTAVDQFGKGDKYFGVCTMMATLPGLPMFGHGQIEGFTERYGMEYRRAYHEETPDAWLVARHEREISPLLHRRALFADVREFLLYDFFTSDGRVNEDVFAYSNKLGDHRALVVYNNRYADTRGWIRLSCAYAEKGPDGNKALRQRTIGQAFGLSDDPSIFVAYRDGVTGLEYLHRGNEVFHKGLRIELGAYKCYVLLDWRSFRDDNIRPWGMLCEMLAGRGVSSIEYALHMLELKPVHDALYALLDPTVVEELVEYAQSSPTNEPDLDTNESLIKLCNRARTLLEQTRRLVHPQHVDPAVWSGEIDLAAKWFEQRLILALRVPSIEQYFLAGWPEEACAVLPGAATAPTKAVAIWGTIISWCALEAMGRLHNPEDPERAAADLFDTLRLREPLAEAFATLGLTGEERWQSAARVRTALAHALWALGRESVSRRGMAPYSWLHDPDVAWLIGVHEHEGVRYFVKEPFERLLWWLALRNLLAIAELPTPEIEAVRTLERQLELRFRNAAESGYRIEALFESWQL